MNWRRYFFALGAAGILTVLTDVVLNAVVFRDVYTRSAPFLAPAPELNTRVWLGWAALIIIVAAFGLLLVRGRWLGFRAGLEFGLILAVASVAGVAGIGSVVAWPAELLAAIAVQQFINALLLGAVFGVIYKPLHAQ